MKNILITAAISAVISSMATLFLISDKTENEVRNSNQWIPPKFLLDRSETLSGVASTAMIKRICAINLIEEKRSVDLEKQTHTYIDILGVQGHHLKNDEFLCASQYIENTVSQSSVFYRSENSIFYSVKPVKEVESFMVTETDDSDEMRVDYTFKPTRKFSLSTITRDEYQRRLEENSTKEELGK